MSNAACSHPVKAFDVITTPDEAIEEHVRRVLQFAQPKWNHPERRAHPRVAFPHLIPLTPLDEQTLQPIAETIYVVGKHLALRGLDFFHQAPIPQRRALVSLPYATDRWIHLVLKVSWCRFIRTGWYDSGGCFVRIADRSAESLPTVTSELANASYACNSQGAPQHR